MYEISIKEIKIIKKRIGKDWGVVERTGDVYKYDYTPEIEKEIEQEQEIYNQKCETLDVGYIIRAVNPAPISGYM